MSIQAASAAAVASNVPHERARTERRQSHPGINSPTDESSRPDRSLRVQSACTLLVAAGSAYVSYRHGREFALRFGADVTTATLWPLIVDGLLTMATIELWKTGHLYRVTGQWKAWLSFSLGVALSLCANIASAPELNAFSVAVAACPPLALLLSVELLNQALKRHRAETVNGSICEPGQHTPPHFRKGSGTVSPLEESRGPADDPTQHNSANNASEHDEVSISEGWHNEDRDPLREKAYRLDAEHWSLNQRPISADTLRKKLGIGSTRARALTRHIRQRHQPTNALDYV